MSKKQELNPQEQVGVDLFYYANEMQDVLSSDLHDSEKLQQIKILVDKCQTSFAVNIVGETDDSYWAVESWTSDPYIGIGDFVRYTKRDKPIYGVVVKIDHIGWIELDDGYTYNPESLELVCKGKQS